MMAWYSRARSSFSALMRALRLSSSRSIFGSGIGSFPFAHDPSRAAWPLTSDAGISRCGWLALRRHGPLSDGQVAIVTATLIIVTPKPILCLLLFLVAAGNVVHSQSYPLPITDRA